MKFDSIGERDRYICLLQDQEAGRIRNLKRQVKFPLTCNGVVVCHYIADFQYEIGEGKMIKATMDFGFGDVRECNGFGEYTLVVEDFKGFLTETFQLKAKMFRACYGFDITITKRRGWRSAYVMDGKSWTFKN